MADSRAVINQDIVLTSHSDPFRRFLASSTTRVLGFIVFLLVYFLLVEHLLTAGSLLAFLSFKRTLTKILFEPLISTITNSRGIVLSSWPLIWVRTPYLQFSISFLMALPSSTLQYLRGLSALTSSLLRWLMYTKFTVGNALKQFIYQLMPPLKTVTLTHGFLLEVGNCRRGR